MPGGKQHTGLREHGQEREQGDVERALCVRSHRSPEDVVGCPSEAPRDLLLLGERLDDVHAHDRLLGDGRDLAELLLDITQHGMGDVAVAVGDPDEDRRDRERDQCQLPLVEEEDGGDADDRDHVLREEDQAVAEEEADRLQVDRGPRHQLPGLMAVVVPEREPQQASVEGVAHVPLDGERLLPRDKAAPEHQQGPQKADAENDEDQEREVVAVLPTLELVDHEARQHDHRDCRRLREDRKNRRDDQGRAIRPQELQQTNEGA